ncbi:hypothetical protein VNO77_16273 [Canavalia gladiata]|uniref:Uncharacterized protein n=1 Tax=Canavalia gladiata TaxID=3824 RepID=A0AAN9QPS1_CANGL
MVMFTAILFAAVFGVSHCLIQLMDMHSPVNGVHGDIISKLENNFSESLHIQDAEKSKHASEGGAIGNCDVGEGNLCESFQQQETEIKMKCLKECSTLPFPDMMLPSISSVEEADTSFSKQSPHQSYTCPVTFPPPPKLVSAMKGSREKQGRSQMKLTVKWAPDVYDPVPTILSHTVKSKKQQKSRIRKSEKRNGKKGYSKRGSGKGKQNRNSWLHSRDEMFETSIELNDLDVNHDSNCGTSFLKTSVTKVHWPIGEAL